MKNLKNLGKTLTKIEQKDLFGGGTPFTTVGDDGGGGSKHCRCADGRYYSVTRCDTQCPFWCLYEPGWTCLE